MNQRVENELHSILNDLEALGLTENDLISDCLRKDGIEIPRPKLGHFAALLGFFLVGLGYYGFFHAGARAVEEGGIVIKRDIPAFVGRDNTLCFPAQVQVERDDDFVERWHWDYGEYGELNGFIQRFTCDTTIVPLTVTCYRQGEKFKTYDPDLKPLPRSLTFNWSANQIIRYGVLDDQSENHGLWIEFHKERAVTAELWNHGHQVGMAKRNEQDEWVTQVKVNGFEMPENPVSAWSEINAEFFNPDYARTLNKVEHDTILYGPTLAKLVEPMDEDKAAFAEMIDSLSDETRAKWDHFAAQLKKDEAVTIRHIELEHEKEMENDKGLGKISARKVE